MQPLIVEQIYTSCLAQGSYYIISNNEAIIIDPLRESKPYMDRLAKDGVKLKYIFETHFHADFVSGHLDLSKLTGASIVYGPGAQTNFSCINAKDQEVFYFGNCSIRAIHTPGHTLESTVYLLIDENGKEHSLFTGDTLFIGDVGRPDLAQSSSGLTKEELAGMLYDSLHSKIVTLPSHINIYPAHGAGSACGKNMSNETVSTLQHQLQHNYALRKDLTKSQFIKEVLFGLTDAPEYFKMNVDLNKKGYLPLEEVMKKSNQALDLSDFENMIRDSEILILDTRNPEVFALGFIPGSLNIGLNGDFAPWVGAIISNVNQKLVLICEEGKEVETILRLSRVGFDSVLGYLKGGYKSWQNANKPTDHILRITANQLTQHPLFKNLPVIDIRRETEYELEHIKNASNLPLANIHIWSDQIVEQKTCVIHCAGGYRSMIAASVLKAKGFHNFVEIEGGFKAIKNTDIKLKSSIPVEMV